MATPRISRFPDELVIEVFRDACFSRPDLARLARVSRRYLDSVRKSLYATVPICLVPHEDNDDIDPADSDDLAYKRRTWELLRTLKTVPGLAALVDELVFDLDPMMGAPLNSSGVGTTLKGTMTTFLRLAPNVAAVSFTTDWPRDFDSEEIIRNHGAKVVRLEIPFTEVKRLEMVSAKLESFRGHLLRHEDNVLPLNFPNLVHLDLEAQEYPLEGVGAFATAWSKLRILKINVDAACDLDFSSMPLLETLHLYDVWNEPRPSGTHSHSAYGFLGNLRGARSLRTLVLEGTEYRRRWESDLFDSGAVDQTPAPPNLRTVQFAEDLRLDRIATILDSRFFKHVRRVVLAYDGRQSNIPKRRSRQLRAVEGMCGGTEVELVLLETPRPEPLWEFS
ncbi:hypothetical protein JCM11491_005561 [Sporobolomyces phaffii]